ncbi:MAG: hypothetical protein NUV76_12725 [Candidatus Kuenenia sp.]|nr:hypothetical protein [Candidatus Kuenenia sp.]
MDHIALYLDEHDEWMNNVKPHAGIILSDQLAVGVLIRRLHRFTQIQISNDLALFFNSSALICEIGGYTLYNK